MRAFEFRLQRRFAFAAGGEVTVGAGDDLVLMRLQLHESLLHLRIERGSIGGRGGDGDGLLLQRCELRSESLPFGTLVSQASAKLIDLVVRLLQPRVVGGWSSRGRRNGEGCVRGLRFELRQLLLDALSPPTLTRKILLDGCQLFAGNLGVGFDFGEHRAGLCGVRRGRSWGRGATAGYAET
ncbi:MAG: hypothetical protein HYR72_24675 [Deltaproteobacteria bacterium]|nr:hypothetical protein [Deltaproteobacteria bacterium]MBI3389298.1 hypothetical protein [Deltaproteobacteria bacterium]